jgi:aspartate dehydrogenase
VLSVLAANLPAPLERVSLLIREGKREAASARLARMGPRLADAVSVHADLPSLLADNPCAVAECAGHGAVREHGAAVLESGRDMIVISVGALADDALRADLEDAARRGGAKLVLPPGAIGGLDALAAARLSGIEEATYTGRKPPRAWRGTAAERLLDLDALREPVAFYEGTAREAARDYPQNANVAAAVALAGAGFDRTRVRLLADPGIQGNVHEVAVRSACVDFTLRLEGRPSPANPKTSLTAGHSAAREVLNRAAAMVI